MQWAEGEWPTYENVSGVMTGDFVLPVDLSPSTVPPRGEVGLSGADDVFDFEPGSQLPGNAFNWRLPVQKNYAISPDGQDDTLKMASSVLDLTGWDADSTRSLSQTILARRQEHTCFRFSVDVEWDGLLTGDENEVSVTALQDEAQHFDFSVAMLKRDNSEGPVPHIRFRGISTRNYRLPERFKYEDGTSPLPEALMGQKIRLQVEALDATHYAFSAGLGGCEEETDVPYYSGVVVSAYAASF